MATKMKRFKNITYVLLFILFSNHTFAQQTGKWGDQGDGTFRNPIIAADFSDPDIVRVGNDYYMVSSTFESVPGVSVLHSTDLVNWEILGGVFDNLDKVDPAFSWKHMERYNLGVYAPTIRFHDGKFWVFVNFFTDGFFVATAKNAAGPWNIRQLEDKNGKPLRTVKWTDPCPFWDSDGRAYLGASRPPGNHWYSYLFQMTADGGQLLDADVDHMNIDDIVYEYPKGGTLTSPHFSSEGNKIYKRNGYYYLMHIEFIGENPGTYIYRSRHIYGTNPDGTPGEPGDVGEYEIRRTDLSGAELGGEYVQELPGQGGLFDTPDGRWFYIAQFNRFGSDGRTPCLLPVTWVDDWPIIGDSIENGYGKMAWHLPKPIPSSNIILPHGSDDFSSGKLTPFWSWNHQPRDDLWSLSERRGYLRLYAVA
ncbi:MAG: family 43 glycosylhydrolase, partial [Melioribacteraceae bacterium]|nr:family 43 glycosylhydrolase [Melioribacteraceae bacterium]